LVSPCHCYPPALSIVLKIIDGLKKKITSSGLPVAGFAR
jgi:hypothetical protein